MTIQLTLRRRLTASFSAFSLIRYHRIMFINTCAFFLLMSGRGFFIMHVTTLVVNRRRGHAS